MILTSVLGLPFHLEPSDMWPHLSWLLQKEEGCKSSSSQAEVLHSLACGLPVRKVSAGLWNRFLSVPRDRPGGLPASRLFVGVDLAAAGQAERVAHRLQGTSPSWGQAEQRAEGACDFSLARGRNETSPKPNMIEHRNAGLA